MIFDEANQPFLIAWIGTEMQPNTLGVLMLQAIVEPFVVAEIESLLLQFPLQVPIGLGHEQDVRIPLFHSADQLWPVFGLRHGARAAAPCPRKDIVEQQHGHIAAKAVALLSETPNPSDEDIDAAMSGNLCRCATYHRIRGAIHEAARILEA